MQGDKPPANHAHAVLDSDNLRLKSLFEVGGNHRYAPAYAYAKGVSTYG